MTEYRVTWSMDIEADTPEKAARIAQVYQQVNRTDLPLTMKLVAKKYDIEPNGYWCGTFEVVPVQKASTKVELGRFGEDLTFPNRMANRA